jgi:hypothetical protein
MQRGQWIALGVVIILACLFFYKQRSGFEYEPRVGQNPPGIPVSTEYKPGFLPSRQGPWFQGMPPSLRVENDYHSCILENGGDYGNYELRQKCYTKTLKNGTFDKADLMCWRHRHNEDDYYKCLDSIYGNLLWVDRFAGLKPCICPDGRQGASTSEDECFCPEYRPLHDRREFNQFDQPFQSQKE